MKRRACVDNLKTRLCHMLISPIVRLLRQARSGKRSLRACSMCEKDRITMRSPKHRAHKIDLRQNEAKSFALLHRKYAKRNAFLSHLQTPIQSQNAQMRVCASRDCDDGVNCLNNIFIIIKHSQHQHTRVQNAQLRVLRIKRLWVLQFSIPP